MKYLAMGIFISIFSIQIACAAPIAKTSTQSFLDKVDSFRVEKQVYFESLRDAAKDRIALHLANTGKKVIEDTLGVDTKDPETIGQTQDNNLGNPEDYITFTFYSGLATVFGNSLYFYAVCIVIVLAFVRAIFRRAF